MCYIRAVLQVHDRKSKVRVKAAANDILKSAERPFNIIEEFSSLSPKRKMLLCDYLFLESRQTFEATVKLLWPEAGHRDMKKLQSFLNLLKKKNS